MTVWPLFYRLEICFGSTKVVQKQKKTSGEFLERLNGVDFFTKFAKELIDSYV